MLAAVFSLITLAAFVGVGVLGFQQRKRLGASRATRMQRFWRKSLEEGSQGLPLKKLKP